MRQLLLQERVMSVLDESKQTDLDDNEIFILKWKPVIF